MEARRIENRSAKFAVIDLLINYQNNKRLDKRWKKTETTNDKLIASQGLMENKKKLMHTIQNDDDDDNDNKNNNNADNF